MNFQSYQSSTKDMQTTRESLAVHLLENIDSNFKNSVHFEIPFPLHPYQIKETQIFKDIDFVIANGKKHELARLKSKIECSGGKVRLNFSRSVKYYIVPYGKKSGTRWKNIQGRKFGLIPIDERFVDICIYTQTLIESKLYSASLGLPKCGARKRTFTPELDYGDFFKHSGDEYTTSDEEGIDILLELSTKIYDR